MRLARRGFLAQAALAAAGWLGLGSQPAWAAESAPDPALLACRPADPLQALLDGNRRFARAWAAADAAPTSAARARILQELWAGNCYTSARILKAAQAPWAAVLTCADSRVAPEWIFDAALSDLFVIRSAGNTASAEAIASLEYAVDMLATPLILVMGHSDCGAVRAALGRNPLTPLLTDLVTPIRAGIQAGDDLDVVISGHARRVAARIVEGSALIAAAVARRRVVIHSACLDIASGRVTLL